jgi:hypothetical protein
MLITHAPTGAEVQADSSRPPARTPCPLDCTCDVGPYLRRLHAGRLELRETSAFLTGVVAGRLLGGATLLRGVPEPHRGGKPRLLAWLLSATNGAPATSPGTVTLRFAPPRAAVCTVLTLAANRREQRLSKALAGSGLMLTNMSVLPSPPRHGWRRYVNFELRYGMWGVLDASAYMHAHLAVTKRPRVARGSAKLSQGCHPKTQREKMQLAHTSYLANMAAFVRHLVNEHAMRDVL